MPKLHKREENVRQAKIKLLDLMTELREDLTQGEFLRVITELASDEWASTAKWTIRHERHPDDMDKPGGFE